MNNSTLLLLLAGGLMKATPEDFVNLPRGDTEVTIHFPSQALVGLDEIATGLEKLGFSFPVDRITLLEFTLGFLISQGFFSIMEAVNELIRKGESLKAEAERARQESDKAVENPPKDEERDSYARENPPG